MNSNLSKREIKRQRWHQKFMTEEKSKASSPVTFLPVSVMDAHASSLMLLVNNHLRIEISADFDPSTLKEVIQVLLAP